MVPFVNWQDGSEPVATVIAVGVLTVGVITIVLVVCAEGPLQPLAVTRISTEPEKPLAQVIIPVVVFIVPAALLLNDQLKPVLFVAVVAKAVVVVPLTSWQEGGVPVIVVGGPTVGVTTTVLVVCEEGPLQPLAVTLISTEPEKPFAQVITPVVALIEPAVALLNDQLKPVLFVALVA